MEIFTNLTGANLYLFHNTSINNQCTNFNISLTTFTNTSMVNWQSNLTAITNLSATNASLPVANVSTLKCNALTSVDLISIINKDPSQTTISAGYVGPNKLVSSIPGYNTYRWTFNMHGYDATYTHSVYKGIITNVLYGTTTANTKLTTT